MVGVLALYLLLQIVVSLIGGTVIVSISFAVGGAGTEVGDALFDNGIQVVMAVSQLIAAAIFGLWWRRVRLGSFAGRRGAGASAGAPVMKTIASLLLVGFAAQFFVSGILGFVELFFPETMAEYAELMEDSAVGVFAIIQVISTVILAPLNEEIVCRGVMLEYAMRAVSPGWDPRHRARRRTVSVRAFWVANVLQALAFGVLHMNIIQGSYAFALGILQGWVFWRTGKLGYAMLLHFALNASSYLVAPLAPMVNVLPTPIVFAVFGGLLAGGIAMFERAWHVSDALPEVEVAEDDEEDGAPADDDAILGDVLPTDDAAARASAVSTGPGKGGSPL
ncbi:CPBP family intramembrane metalloprotease [Collinsella sp. AF08-23]|nr:CPBP family intramembrane metalloprotease [Collinsella sp. AF08-23]